MKLPFAVALALLLAVTATRAQAPKPEEAAQTAAESWLALLDGGKFAESWSATAAPLQKLVPEKRWELAIAAVETSLGKLESRKLRDAKFTRTLPGAPDAEYVVLQFDSSFEKKKTAVETVTPMKDADGTWKVSGYYVK